MTVRIAVLGVGRIGSLHAELLAHRVPGAEVALVYDAVPEVAAAMAESLAVPPADSLEAVWEDAGVDAVAICTNADSHIDVMTAAAQAGRHVFCEKPLSLDLAEVDRGLAAMEATGVKLQIGFNRRFDPSHRAVAEDARAGRIGAIHLVRITSRDPEPPPIAYLEGSGGIFRDMMIHDFDMARYVVGSEVAEVYATGAVRVDPAIGEIGDFDTAVVVLTHEDGTITTIDNSRQSVYGYDQRVEAFGSEGMSASQNFHQHHAEAWRSDGVSRAPLVHFFLERYVPSYIAEWEAFVTSVAEDREPLVTGRDGRAPLVMGLAAERSVHEGRPVRCDEIASIA